MNQEFISFKVSREILCYVAANVQDAAVKSAMAKALSNTADNTGEITVTIHEAQAVTIYAALTGVPEGIGAQPNKLLIELLQPHLETHPRMAGMIAELQARNQASYEQVLQAGEKELERIAQLLRMN